MCMLYSINPCTCSVLNRTDHPWHFVYHFLDNRVQAIRLDITYQVDLSNQRDNP